MSQDDNLIVYLVDLKRNQQFVVNQMDEDEMPTTVHDNRIQISYCTYTEHILEKIPASNVNLARDSKKTKKSDRKIVINDLKSERSKPSKNVDKKAAVELTDSLTIQFDHSQRNQFCKVLIHNNCDFEIHLNSVDIDLHSIKLCRCNNLTEQSVTIRPKTNLGICFEATFVPKKYSEKAKVHFDFGTFAVIRRTIDIRYHGKGPIIQKNHYDAPQQLVDLIASEKHTPRSVILDTLDQWMPSVDVNYAKHFHDLFYLEEIGVRKEIKDKYNQIEAYFNDIETVHENDKIIRRKYAIGIYDLEVRDLFETRPSLQIGDKIFARKHSSPTVCYEGVVIEIKDSDLICIQFKDDFVQTFDNTAYIVEFDFTRNMWIRLHFALDVAWNTFGAEYLIPKQFTKRNAALIDVHLNEDNRMEATNGKVLKWFNNNLNFHQKQAVANVLRADLLNPYLIHGPPGTGKTTTLTEIILQILTNIQNSNILITTQSNSAANLIVQRLVQFNEVNTDNLWRLISINYARKGGVLPDDIRDYACTVDELLPNDDDSNVNARLSSAKRFRVVVGTSTKIAHMLECRELRNHFTHAIIDEAGQSHELGVLVPMALIGRQGQTIMAGDPMQMPPIVINEHANNHGLNISMLSRLLDCYSNIEQFSDGNQKSYISQLISKLIQNYRSLPSILEFYNTQFYNSELISMIDAENSHEAKLLNHISQSPIFNRSNNYGIYFINVDGQNVKRKNSYCNPEEICVIRHLVHKLKPLGFSDESMGIITPYSLQQRQIEMQLCEHENIKIGTVEDFQGLERNVILISTVRTCLGAMKIDISRYLGFVKCPKRINVAISRARALVIVVGKRDLLSTDENWNALICKCKLNGTFGNATVKKCKANRTLSVQKIELL